MSIEDLKEQARRHEQKEDWEKALDLYLRAIRKLDEEEDQDLSLYNRVGDLEVRLGRVERAVDHYEEAVDLYVESELPNNAIAICKKVVRNLPQRDSIYLRMGQIRAEQGFLTDARQNFLTYAERKQASGNLEEAFRALVEFVELAPDDIEIRLSLAEQLAQHDREEEAVEQFREARRRLILADREEEAEVAETRLRELRPGMELEDPDAVRSAGPGPEPVAEEGDDWGGARFSDFSLGSDEDPEGVEAGDGPVVEPDAVPLDGEGTITPTDEPVERPDDLDGGEAEREADEERAADEDVEVDGLEGFEIAGDEDEEAGEEEIEEEEAVEPLPTIDFEDEEVEEEEDPLPMMDVDIEEEPGAEEDRDVLDEDGDAADEDRLPVGEEPEADDDWLAAIEVPDVEEAEAAAPEEDRAVETAPESEAAESLRSEGETRLEAGDESGLELLSRAHEAFAERGDLDSATEVVGRMLKERPDDVELHQRRVDYAYRTMDEDALVGAYLGLAAALRRGGDEEKARTVYQQVLEIAPANDEAAAELAALRREGTEPAEPRREVASSEEYVDLGSMILEEEEEKSTRFVVAADALGGDEEADFEKMLSQFKEKVAENVDTGDVAAHYDLGTAYKEMGLVDEAISEFQAALRGQRKHLPTYEMLGQCFLEKEQGQAAVRTLEKALELPFEVEDELLGIYYFLGRAHEQLGRVEEAVDFYDKVFALDINFMDVTERLRALR